jgi:magnesium transporter
MEVLRLSGDTTERFAPEALPELAKRDDGFVWVDVPALDDEAERLLSDAFGFHPMALRDCRERTHVPRLHTYPDHLFVIVHAPEQGDPGHIHLLELDVFIGPRFLVTVHGPYAEGVPVEEGLRETEAVRARIESGRFRPGSPAELWHAIVSGLARRMEQFVSALAQKVAGLERRVMKGEVKDPEETLEELFFVRHELLTLQTMAAQSHEVYARLQGLSRFLPPETEPLLADLVDRFQRVSTLCGREKEFLHGVVDFYQSKTATKMNIAMERLALLAAIALPVTAIASVYGMNVIVNAETDFAQVGIVVAVMVGMMATMLRWAKRHGWW